MAEMTVDGVAVYSREPGCTTWALFTQEQIKLFEAGFTESFIVLGWLRGTAVLANRRINEVEPAVKQLLAQ